ncbi:hypothetical protein [Sphingomonas montanisoli]|uniref:Lipoprotein n=1 Tax=Sphingomonas montanisoli TaxID=2606412 RepID=A0A5D9CDM9_9SPHN|nr:hypothetical protein [Sphingomonas montanisoli]TZG29447.1 hypothetical protein FYJ91_04805 [Sphingomonas montanisoli]
MLRSMFLGALLLLLTGCWTSRPWFAASDGKPVIPDGHYRFVTGEMPGEGDLLSTHNGPDGSMAIDGGDQRLVAILVPLGKGDTHRHIVQLQRDDGVARNALFMLLDDSKGRYRLALLPCAKPWSERAEASGGSIVRDPQSAASCIFATRAALLAALTAVSKSASFDLELIPEAR